MLFRVIFGLMTGAAIASPMPNNNDGPVIAHTSDGAFQLGSISGSLSLGSLPSTDKRSALDLKDFPTSNLQLGDKISNFDLKTFSNIFGERDTDSTPASPLLLERDTCPCGLSPADIDALRNLATGIVGTLNAASILGTINAGTIAILGTIFSGVRNVSGADNPMVQKVITEFFAALSKALTKSA